MEDRTIYVTDDDHRRLMELLASREEPDGRALAQEDDLRRELERAVVVPSAAVPRHVITMHSRFRLKDLDTGEVKEYTLAFPDEADVSRGKLSVLAPVGTALLGCRDLDVVEWQVPVGRKRFRVNALSYQPEAAGACRSEADSPIRGARRADRRSGRSFRALHS